MMNFNFFKKQEKQKTFLDQIKEKENQNKSQPILSETKKKEKDTKALLVLNEIKKEEEEALVKIKKLQEKKRKKEKLWADLHKISKSKYYWKTLPYAMVLACFLVTGGYAILGFIFRWF